MLDLVRRLALTYRVVMSSHHSSTLLLLLLCASVVCLLTQRGQPEAVPVVGRHRPRLPWLRGQPSRRAVLTSTPVAVVGATCTNLATGAELAVDHRGFLCYREQLAESGCCGPAHLGRFNCDGCEVLPDGSGTGSGVCCLEFERCVSCCIGAAGMESAATVELALTMEGCAGRCRTASKSLDGAVWNRYRSEHKYCNDSGDGVDTIL